jgi:hypothetical protein
LEEVGTGADVAEGSDIVAERSLLAGHLEVFHEGEIVLREIGLGPAAAADEGEDICRMGIAVRSRTSGSLCGHGERSASRS